LVRSIEFSSKRKPEDGKDIDESSSMKLHRLDVQDEEGIKKTIEKVIGDFGEIDAVLNNAGKRRIMKKVCVVLGI